MAEITICGAGIFGLTLAWGALGRGASVTVIDPKGPGAGASGGVVGALQPHTPSPWNAKKQMQFESLIMARTFWAEVDAASGLSSGYAAAGRVMPLVSDREVALAQERAVAAREHWGDAATWSVLRAGDLGAWCPPSPTGFYVRDTLSALLHPRAATHSLAGAVRAKGGKIVAEGAPTGPVIWATGWDGLKDLSADLGREVGNGVKGQAAVLGHDARGAPQIYAEGLHIIPHLNGTVAVGSTSERGFDAPGMCDGQVDDLIARARGVMPMLANAPVLERWAGVRPRAISRAPLLGPWPRRAGHFVANGGFKIGFGMAPKCAELLLDLVLDGKDAIPETFHTNAL